MVAVLTSILVRRLLNESPSYGLTSSDGGLRVSNAEGTHLQSATCINDSCPLNVLLTPYVQTILLDKSEAGPLESRGH